jgi:hypothetical protein
MRHVRFSLKSGHGSIALKSVSCQKRTYKGAAQALINETFLGSNVSV